MQPSVTRWGVGPIFAFFSGLMFVAALVFHYALHPFFRIESIPSLVLVSIGVLSVLIGLAIWIAAAKAIGSGLEEERLVTQGVYAFFRHPIYSQAMLLTAPGVALFFRMHNGFQKRHGT